MLTLFAAIAFGSLGPVERVVFSDAKAHAEIRYRIAHDRMFDTGEAAVSPSIATGTLTFVAGGRRRTYDLARIFPIHETRIVLPTKAATGCGASRPLTRHGDYLVVEAIVAEKGCAPVAAFIDIASGDVAEDVVLDPQWTHRFDARPEMFSGQPLLVTRDDSVTLESVRWNGPGHQPTLAAWPFVVVHATDAEARTHLLAFDTADLERFPTSGNPVPAAGSRVTVGTVDSPHLAVVLPLAGERVLHLSPSDDVRYAARQTPAPPNIERNARRNSWFLAADDDAEHGRFDDAVRAFAMVVADDVPPVDSEIRSGDVAMLAHCRALAKRVAAGQLTSAAASSLFQSGCEEKPAKASQQAH